MKKEINLPEKLWKDIYRVSKAFGSTPDELIRRLVEEGLRIEEHKLGIMEDSKDRLQHPSI